MHGLMWRELETGSRAVTVMAKNDRRETAWPPMAPSPTAVQSPRQLPTLLGVPGLV